jgi:Domain of unknown function (DUF1735)
MKTNVKFCKNICSGPANMVWIGILCIFSSCLKNSNYNTPFSTVDASVDLPLSAANNNSLISFSYTEGQPAYFPVYINLASPNTLGISVTATLTVDTAFLNNYNSINSTDFQLLPDSDYTVLNGWARDIPAGHRLDSMYVMYNLDKMDLSARYVLPITIQNASVPIEQWNHLLINPQVKNKYDGEYDLIIKTVGWGAFGIADGPPALDYGSLGMVTSGGSGLVFDIGAQPGFTNTGDPTSFGATNPQLTFDPVTNQLVSVVNLAPDDGRGRMFQIDSTVTTSHWDPVTKNIYAAYLMFQNGRPTQYIYDTLIYQGPRP